MDIKPGALGLMVPNKEHTIQDLTHGVPARDNKDTVEVKALALSAVSCIYLTILDEVPWQPKWLILSGRSAQTTEHSSSIHYRKVLLQCENEQKILWMSNRTIGKFCWDEKEQLEKLSPTPAVFQHSQTCL